MTPLTPNPFLEPALLLKCLFLHYNFTSFFKIAISVIFIDKTYKVMQ